jgi:hypothetical protein
LTFQNHITASCTVRNQHIYKNDALVFSFPSDQGHAEGSALNIDASDQSRSDAPAFLLAAYRHLEMNYPKFHKMDNLSKLGLLATEVLLKENEIKQKHESSRIGVILSNKNASLDSDIKYFESVRSIPSPALFVYTLPNIMTGEICIKHSFKGENAFFVSDDFDEVFIHRYVAGLLDNHIIDACICGWVEVFADKYDATLLLVEKVEENSLHIAGPYAFTTENIKNIYALHDGKVNV